MTHLRTHAEHPLQTLARAPRREQIPALGEVLRLAPEPEREAVALRLFELAAAGRAPDRGGALGPVELVSRWPKRMRVRDAERAMFELVCGWSQIPESVRGLARGLARERWLRIATAASDAPDPAARVSAARFAEDTAEPGLARMVCTLLRDEHQSVRRHADRALLRLAVTLLGHVPEALLGSEFGAIAARPALTLRADPGVIDLERVELCRQIADASWSFSEHRCRSPLVAALLVLDRVPGGTMERAVAARIRRLLNEPAHPSHPPIRTALRRTPSPLLRERALRWIVLDPMRPTCVERLSEADSIEEHEITLRRAYLAVRPRRGTRLRSVRLAGPREHGPVPAASDVAKLSTQARRGHVRFVSLIGLEDEARRLALEPTLADSDAMVRLAGAHAAHPADLSDYAFDPDASVARSAATRWSTLGVAAPQAGGGVWSRRREVAGLLTRSPHESVRAIARAEADRLDMFAPTPAGRLAARRAHERDPVAFVRTVRAAIGEEAGVLAALTLVRALDVGARFEMDLVQLATTAPDDRVRATAVAALGRVDSEGARRVVRASLHAPDQRVRSNAVEAVEVDPAVLLEYKDDQSHRVRASAVRRLLAAGDPWGATGSEGPIADRARIAAAESLARMLTDDRAAHRLSGAWAAERVVLPERRDAVGPAWRGLVRRVTDAATNDHDERVRLRAGRCLRRLGGATTGSAA